MIAYSLNMMGPWSMDWYRDRGLTRHCMDTIKTEFLRNLSIGSEYDYEEVITYYAGGRIDIRGLPEDEFYNGWYEYSLPVMHGEDFNEFSRWLDEHYTEELMPYEDIIALFEKETNTQIRWLAEDDRSRKSDLSKTTVPMMKRTLPRITAEEILVRPMAGTKTKQ